MMNNETNSIRFDTLEKMCDIFDCEIGDIIVRKKGKKKKWVKNKKSLKNEPSGCILSVFYFS